MRLLRTLALTACMTIGSWQVIAAAPVQITVSSDKTAIGMGQCVQLTASAKTADGKPAVGWTLLPYVNGQRWGAHEIADANGKAHFQIPLPRVGIQQITVGAVQQLDDTAHWIWAQRSTDNQIITASHSYDLPWQPTKAVLWSAADNQATMTINGKPAGVFTGWTDAKATVLDPKLFHPGPNKFEARVENSNGPGGFIMRLELSNGQKQLTLVSDGSWMYTEGSGNLTAVKDLGGAHSAIWTMPGWPNANLRQQLYTAAVCPKEMPLSNTISVQVDRRKLQAPPKDPDHLVIMQWENWYGPTMYNWQTSHAVPLVGFYQTADENVLRQHIIWMIEAGTDIIQCDMSNNIWDAKTWDERSGMSDNLIFVNGLMMETLAKMRDEGIDVPKFIALSGVNNTPNALTVINGQLNHLYQSYINNPRFSDLWYRYEGKPLIVILDPPSFLKDKLDKTDPRWTIKPCNVHMEKFSWQRDIGYWSWMDTDATLVRNSKGEAEQITASVGCFTEKGWKDPLTRGRRGGATLVEDWALVMKDRPRFVNIHQFQEFAGQIEGEGSGGNPDMYVDSYSVDLSDDLEPVSLTAPGYRGNGGWGYYYLNLNKALVDMLRQKTPETTVLVVAKPDRRHEVSGNSMELQWRSVGKPLAQGVTVAIDGKVVATGLKKQNSQLDISKLKLGLHTITLTAPGAQQRYRLLWNDDSLPLSSLEPSTVTMEFIKTAVAPKEKAPNAR
ncbi:MAG: glycoside hydrolase family 71/99 protein [Armatimonadota bacterium]